MITHFRTHARWLALLAFLVVPSFFLLASTSRAVGKNEILSTVQILILTNKDEVNSFGSGTIIDAEGDILTNAHVLEAAVKNDGWYPVVLFTIDPKRPPISLPVRLVLKGYNSDVDLAVLRIQDIKNTAGEYVDFRKFLADNNAEIEHVHFSRSAYDIGVGLGDAIQILGYPGVGGENITLTKGTVSGFESLEIKGEYYPTHIKTDAKINPGNSGGAAFDANDNFIGVPQAVAGGQGNIGYVIGLPLVNLFLNDVLGAPIKEPTGSTCPDLVNGFLGDDGSCHCNPGYDWDNMKGVCAKSESGLPGTTIKPPDLTDEYCQTNVRPNSIFNPATGNCECKEGLMLAQNDCVPIPPPKYYVGTPHNRTDVLNCSIVTDTKTKTYWRRGHKAVKTLSLKNKSCVATEAAAVQKGFRRVR